MKTDPRMSPLFVREWAALKEPDREPIIEDLKPPIKLLPGDSFQVQSDGSFLPLKPGDIVPERPVREERSTRADSIPA